MKAFLPPSQSLRTHSFAVTSNATYLNSRAAIEAARSTTAAAEAMLERSAIADKAAESKRRPSSRKSVSSANARRESEAKTQGNSPSKSPPKTAPLPPTDKPQQPRGDVEVFPEWIRERKDFQVFFPRYADRVITDDEILRQGVPKEPSERNIVELQCLARWIMKIPSMQTSLDLSQATEIAKLAKYQHFKPREFVFRKGDRGDACYLVFAGEVHVLINNEKVASVTKNAAFGDIALQIENATRGADVVAVYNPNFLNPGGVEVLKIQAEDYHKTLARCQSRRRKHLIGWLHTEVAIFRDCVESKLHFFELVSIDVPLKKGQVLYTQGDSVGAFYIVRSGKVRLEVDIQYQHKNRWPSGTHEWEEQVRAVTSRVAFHVEETGGFFGFEMFVDGQQQRAYTVIADSHDVQLVALNRVDCFSPYFSFTPRAIDKIMEKHDKCRELSVKQMRQKLKDFKRMASQQKRSTAIGGGFGNSSGGGGGGGGGDPHQRLPLVVEPKYARTNESPQFQFPRLRAATWDAENEVVRALQLACK